VWDALIATMARPKHIRRRERLAHALGCVITERKGEPGAIGSKIPGFIVTRSIEPAVLALMGEHRYSRYALIFYATDTAAGPVRLSAETRAQFPGVRGQIYKTLVIRSGGHAIATKSLLRRVRRRAERD
jgi:hypothetical protein